MKTIISLVCFESAELCFELFLGFSVVGCLFEL